MKFNNVIIARQNEPTEVIEIWLRLLLWES
jgi:hypothetical protein